MTGPVEKEERRGSADGAEQGVEAQGLMDDFEPANALEVKLFDRIRPQLT